MTTERPILRGIPSENWDDDFEFQQPTDSSKYDSIGVLGGSLVQSLDGGSTRSRQTPKAKEKVRSQLQDWAEPGPSTPSRRLPIPQMENWDDDFEDRSNSPAEPKGAGFNSYSLRSRLSTQEPLESWDDEFDLGKAESPKKEKGARVDASRQTSSWADDGEELDGVIGRMDGDEDVTITPKSRGRAPGPRSHPPRAPPTPSSDRPFPGSPTTSMFSVPLSGSGHDSISAYYGSTAHLELTQSGSSAIPIHSPTPPVHRERRRLRKKSRPPHLDGNLIELADVDDEDLASPSHTPERIHSVSPSAIEPSSPSRTPLLSRIGSMSRKLGGRRKRASTGPMETPHNETNADGETSKHTSGWFFRSAGGGIGSGSPPATPTDLNHDDDGPLRSPVSPGRGYYGSRPSTLRLKTDGNGVSSDSRSSSRPAVSRESSQGAIPFVSASAGKHEQDDIVDGNAKEGSRSFMGGVRRLSLVGSVRKKHKRTKSRNSLWDGGNQSPLPSPGLPSPNPLQTSGILPPIELQPPSPPRKSNETTALRVSRSEPTSTSVGIEPILLPSSAERRSGSPTRSSLTSSRASQTKPASVSQSASLGRSSAQNVAGATALPRRNSLGDLKIPARITQAQVGVKRDLGLVKDFAASVGRLKELQSTYISLATEVRSALISDDGDHARPKGGRRATSPSRLLHRRPGVRNRSNTSPLSSSRDRNPSRDQFAAAFHTLEAKYRVTWECAELLIELGGGTPAHTSPSSAPPGGAVGEDNIPPPRKSRERAITLESPPASSHGRPDIAKVEPNPAWRASTGRHDLSQRQLQLLREMLKDNPESSFAVHMHERDAVDDINRSWKWGDSNVTLPSEESCTQCPTTPRKRKGTRTGMSGLRDLLRQIKKSTLEQSRLRVLSPSASSVASEYSADSSGLHRSTSQDHSQPTTQRRRAKTSTGPESLRSLREYRESMSFGTSSSFDYKPTPRRPSLASIFRLNPKHRPPSAEPSSENAATTSSSSVGSDPRRTPMDEPEGYNEMDSNPSLLAAAKAIGSSDGMSTVKGRTGKSPYLQTPSPHFEKDGQQKTPSASESSIWADSLDRRSTKLSNVEEEVELNRRHSRSVSKQKRKSLGPAPSPRRLSSRTWMGLKSGSVRSAPPMDDNLPLPDPKLAMSPENLKPLLENAREVERRLTDCLTELRTLVAMQPD